MAACRVCNEELPQAEKGFIYFHMCKGRPKTETEKTEDEKIEHLAAVMVEITTEYDWDELPKHVQDKIKRGATALYHYTHNDSIMGEVVNEQKAIE